MLQLIFMDMESVISHKNLLSLFTWTMMLYSEFQLYFESTPLFPFTLY